MALLTTDSEFVATANTIQEYQIRDSNLVMLSTAVQGAGGRIMFSKRNSDGRNLTIAAIGQATGADIILCTGGVSVGRNDRVKNAAEENGVTPSR